MELLNCGFQGECSMGWVWRGEWMVARATASSDT